MAGDRYKDEKFVGWLKVNLTLIFAKEGVEQFSDDEIQTFHDNIKHNIPSSSAPGPHTCIDNTKSRQDNKRKLTQEWQRGMFNCQADQCHLWLEGIRREYNGSPKSVEWDNCNLAQLSTDPWACAKLHMPYGSASYTQASDADIASLLTLFLRCNHFRKFFHQVDVCQNVKEIRNRMMHTCKMEVDAASVTAYTTQIIEFLEDPKHLLHQPPCQEAVRKIKELLSGKTEISLNKELELRVLNTELHNLVDVVKALSSKVKDTGADATSNSEDLKALKIELALVQSRSEDFNKFLTDYKIKGVSMEKLSEVNVKIARLGFQIREELSKLTDRVAKLEIHCKTLTKEQGSQKQRLNEVSEEQGSQKQRLKEVSEEQGSQKQRLKEVSEKQGSQKQRLKEVSEEQGSQKQRLEEVSQEQGSQKQRLKEVGQEQGSQKQRLKEVSEEQGSQKQRLKEVSEEQGSQKQRLKEVGQEQGSQKQRLKEVGQEQGSQKQRLKEVSEEQGSQKQRLKEVDQEQGSQKQRLKEVGQEQGSQKQRLKEVSEEQGSQKQRLKEVGQEQGSQKQRLKEVGQEQGSQKQRLKEVGQEQGSQKQRLKEVSQEQGSQKQRLKEVSQEQGSQKQRLKEVSQEQGSQKQRLKEVSQEQGSQKQKLDDLQAGISDVSKKQSGQKQKLDQLKKDVRQEQSGQSQRLDQLETGMSDISQEQQQLKRDVQENLATRESTCQDIQRRLISLYTRECQTIPIYPLRPEWRTHVASLFVLPSMKVTNPRGISKHHLIRGTDEGSDIKVTSIEDIFPPAGSSCTDIYIMGDAGTGKSTLCEYLVHLWVSFHTSSNQAQENFMERFELLFYISLREATSCNVEEMIQSQLKLKNVNVSRLLYDHSSLIILDGLDEYSLKKTSRTRFGSKNVPYRDHSDKCTVLTTSRPWKLELLRRELEHKIDRQIFIVGLDTESQKKLVGKVVDLLNSENNCDKSPDDFFTEVQTQELDKFMNTPVLVMQMLGLWFSGEPLGESRCSIYAKLVDKQIQFTEEVRGLSTDPSFYRAAPNMPELQCDDDTIEQDLFDMSFNNCPFVKCYKNLLQKVCKFAYCSLTGKDRENSLVFSHEQMERSDMSREEISLCLDLGLLTQYKVLGEITQRLKSLSFIHKSNQEFFAAIYLSQIDQTGELKTLLERDFTSLSDILELGTVFMFVCGMNPTVARDISRFIMVKASGDTRLELYRQYAEDWKTTDPNTALVLQLQGLILAGIEEGRHNGHKITGMQLQDLYMDVGEQDFPPARVLACTGSLDLPNIKSLYIDDPGNDDDDDDDDDDDQGAIAGDLLQQLLQATSRSLHKLVLCDTVGSVKMIQRVVKQQQGGLQTLGIINYNIDNVDASHLNQTELQAILSAPTISLALYGLVLTHSQLEFLCQHVSNSSYGEVHLGYLQCTTHGYEESECKQCLNMSANRNLSRLVLYQLPVMEVRFVPENLVRCEIGHLPEPVVTSCISCLQRAEKLEVLQCGGLRGSAVVELCTTMPHLVHLQGILLVDINLSGQQQVVRAMAQLKKLEDIGLYRVTMREEDLRELLAALPSSHRVEVGLGDSSGSIPVTITDCNRHTHLLEHIRHNPHTDVTHDEVKFEGGTCIVKKFWFNIEPGCNWATAATLL